MEPLLLFLILLALLGIGFILSRILMETSKADFAQEDEQVKKSTENIKEAKKRIPPRN